MADFKDFGIGMAAGGGDALIQEIFAAANQRRQKDMANYNQKLALDLWNRTNYSAQVEQMRRAGLNPGLMYKSAGQGGTTQGAGTGQGATAQAPSVGMGLQLGLQAKMTEAQINLANAQAEEARADAQAKGKGGYHEATAQTQMALLAEQTNNEVAKGAIMALDEKIKYVEARIQEDTLEQQITSIRKEADIQIGKAQEALAKGGSALDRVAEEMKQLRQTTAEQMVRINAMKQGIELSEAQIREIGNRILNMDIQQQQKWTELDQDQQRIRIQQILGETGGRPETWRQWVTLAKEVIGIGAGVAGTISGGKGGNPAGFKY